MATGVTLAGCFEKPPFRGDGDGGMPDAGPSPCPGGVVVNADLDGQGRRVVCGPGYTMRFSDQGYGYPDSFVVGGEELLGQVTTCADEDRVGLAFYPAGVVAGGPPPTGQGVDGGRHVDLEVDTPFLVKIGVPWRASFDACGLAPQGRSTFTFFPDGRIFRHDHIVDSSAAGAAACAGSCGPAGATGWHVTSYWTFATTAGQTITPEPPPATSDQGAGRTLQQLTSCVADDAYAVAVNWIEERPRRLRRPSPTTSAYVQESLVGEPATLPGDLDDHLHTQLLVRAPASDCAALRTEVERHTIFNPQLLINDVSLDVAHDGIWGGENDRGEVGYPVFGTTTLRAGAIDLVAG